MKPISKALCGKYNLCNFMCTKQCDVCICKNQKNSHHPTSYHLKSAYLGFTIFLLHHVIQTSIWSRSPQPHSTGEHTTGMQSSGFPARHLLPPDAGADPSDSTRRQRPSGVFKISQESHLKLTHSPFSV